MIKPHASKKNLTPERSSLTPSKLDQSEASVTHLLAKKSTVFNCRGEFRYFPRKLETSKSIQSFLETFILHSWCEIYHWLQSGIRLVLLDSLEDTLETHKRWDDSKESRDFEIDKELPGDMHTSYCIPDGKYTIEILSGMQYACLQEALYQFWRL